jgi:hypothetical protein
MNISRDFTLHQKKTGIDAVTFVACEDYNVLPVPSLSIHLEFNGENPVVRYLIRTCLHFVSFCLYLCTYINKICARAQEQRLTKDGS